MPARIERRRDPIDEHIGRRVRARRLQLGMTQAELARAIEVSERRVRDYEKGAGRVPTARLGMLADVLHLSVSEFYIGYSPPAP